MIDDRFPQKAALALAALLFLAILPLPYGYYTFLRLTVCLASAVSAYFAYTRKDKDWLIIWIGIAILFNPIIPIHFPKEIWIFFNAGAGAVFAVIAYKMHKMEKNSL